MKYELGGEGKIAYALVRPPGHYDQPTQDEGYCFLNNAGLAVQLALNSGFRKVTVVDIDVHYGKGTAEGFYRLDKVLTVSLHMNHGSWGPSHPQNGSVDELGEGEGYNLNVPLTNGTGDRGYVFAMTELVCRAIDEFKPDLMVLVVGQDSSTLRVLVADTACFHNEYGLAFFDIVQPKWKAMLDNEWLPKDWSDNPCPLADKHSGGCILIFQEGEYHLTYLAYCLHATRKGILDLLVPLLIDPITCYQEDEAFPKKSCNRSEGTNWKMSHF